jgi:diguanylate cyclase (GGDEF)-like protein
VLLPEASLECARDRAEQLRLAIRDTNLTRLGQSLPPPTASFGVAAYPANGSKPADFLRMADHALYCAKHEGRDRVCVADPEPVLGVSAE